MTAGGFKRYAIYWMPEPGSILDVFGKRWFANAEPDTGETFGLPYELARRATESPSHYQLHATLKAPFKLREGVGEALVQSALDEFCTPRRPVIAGGLRMGRFQKHLALMAAPPSADVDWLATECVTRFDRFRSALSAEDRTRRPASMPARQAEFLESFGYPYVLSEFEFHVTLAGPLDDADLGEVDAALAPHLASVTAQPLRIESLCLLGEPIDGRPFVLLSRHYFMGSGRPSQRG